MERYGELEARIRRWPVPTWLLGLFVTLIGWSAFFAVPAAGLDPSWGAGLVMATERGMQFGTEVVFTYGPLGFLRLPYLWSEGLASLAFVYTVALSFAFSCALIWTLRFRVGAPLACLIAFLAPALMPVDVALGLAVLWALAVFSERPPRHAVTALITAGAVFAAAEALIKFSTGPVIFTVLLLALIGIGARRREIGTFLGTFAVSFLFFWLVTGQSVGNIPDFAYNSLQIVVGYNEAMAMYGYTFAAVVLMILGVAAAVAWNWFGGEYADRRARIVSTVIVAAVGLAMYKQGVVRLEGTHLAICFAALFVVWAAIPTVRRWNYVLLTGLAAFTVFAVAALDPVSPRLDVVDNLDKAQREVRTLLSPQRQRDIIESNRDLMKATYALEEPVLEQLDGKTVSVDPWEISVAWAYEMDWSPLPVFQNYSAYTPHLDELNAGEVASADGPERILQASQLNRLDERNAAWDPPAQAIATLCHFKPGAAGGDWRVLLRVENRCGPEELAAEVDGSFGEPVEVPAPGPDEVIYARVEGVEPGGLEKIRSLLYKAPGRTATIAGYTYRLIPSTAKDGLMLRAGRRVGDEDGLFSQVPETETIQIDGGSGDLRFDFYRMKVRPAKLTRPLDSGAGP